MNGAVYVFSKPPHDCEFLSAPIGAKHCHYEREVTTVRTRKGQTYFEVSYDEGKTWSPATGPEKPSVLVSWNKVED